DVLQQNPVGSADDETVLGLQVGDVRCVAHSCIRVRTANDDVAHDEVRAEGEEELTARAGLARRKLAPVGPGFEGGVVSFKREVVAPVEAQRSVDAVARVWREAQDRTIAYRADPGLKRPGQLPRPISRDRDPDATCSR